MSHSLPCHLASALSDESVLLDALADVPIPTPLQQKILARRAHAGDRDAFDQLVLGNMRLVGKVVTTFEDRGMSRADLIQEGTIGLMRAVEKFDPDRNIRLSTYATWWIRQAISRALADRGRMVRLPFKASDDIQALRRASRAVEAAGHDVTPEALSAVTGIDPARIRELQRLDQSVASLDVPVGHDSGATLGDLQPDHDCRPDEEGMHTVMTAELLRAMFRLPAQERAVVALSAGLDGAEPQSAADVGRALGISPHRVRQMEREAVEALGHMMGAYTPAAPACPVEPDGHAEAAG